MLEGIGWIRALTTLDTDGDGLDEIIVAGEAPGSGDLTYGVYSGRDLAPIALWRGELDASSRVAGALVQGKPVVAYQTENGLVLDEIGGERLQRLPLEYPLPNGRVQFVGHLRGLGLAAVTSAGRAGCGTLVSLFSDDGIQQLGWVEFEGTSTRALPISHGPSDELWIAVGPEIYRIRSGGDQEKFGR